MEFIDKKDKHWIENVSLAETLQTQFFSYEIDILEMEGSAAFGLEDSVIVNEYRNSTTTLIDIVIEPKSILRGPRYFTILLSDNKKKTKDTIDKFYTFLVGWGKVISKSGRTAWIHLDELYSIVHNVFCLVTWELLNRYSDLYSWDDFGELMFYTLFSPKNENSQYKQRKIPKGYWEFIKNNSSIANDFITLNQTDKGGLYCLFIRDKTFPLIVDYYYGFIFIYVKSLSQIFEIPSGVYSIKRSSLNASLIEVEGKGKNLDSTISLRELNFQNGYLKGRAYTFGLNWNDVLKYRLQEIL